MKDLSHIILQILLHIIRFADKRLHLSAPRQRRCAVPVPVQPFEFIKNDVFTERFHNIIAGPEIKRILRQIFTAGCCYHDKRRIFLELRIIFDLFHHRNPVHPRHHNVHQNHIRLCPQYHFVCFITIFRLSDDTIIFLSLQYFAKHFQSLPVIIRNRNIQFSHLLSSLSRIKRALMIIDSNQILFQHDFIAKLCIATA